MEMACDILGAISAGTTRPTRIMQRANLTWSALLMYLDALMRGGFVARQLTGRSPTYHLTSRGAGALKRYNDLREDLSILKLTRLTSRGLAVALNTEIAGKPGESPKARLIDKLRKEGLEVISSSMVGKSGIRHEYDVVARSANGLTHVYAIVRDEDDKHVLSMHAKQLDTDTLSHVVYSGTATPEALRLAKSYHIELVKW